MVEAWASLEYVRRLRPAVIVVENVTDVSVVAPLTGLLRRLGGYAVETGILSPEMIAKMPTARDRQYWLLTRL